MEVEQCGQAEKNASVSGSVSFKKGFQILTTTLLSLLLPLSFLLIARLSAAQYLLDSSLYLNDQPLSKLFSVFLYTNPILLHVLVSTVSVSAFLHGLSNGRIVVSSNERQEPVVRPHIYTAWIFICALQILVGLGIEGSIGEGVTGSNFGYERSLVSRVMFFFGLHETMLHWSRTVVKPVVDDTVFGSSREEGWAERVLLAASFSVLWWWRLKDEVEALVVVAEVKRHLLSSVGVADVVGWWLYYLIVAVGMIRVVKGVLRAILLLLPRKAEGNTAVSSANDEKV
ncbi:hypothetical protein DCAR_0103035 [Daucus carota subsp. sativus]|uniref:Uncharacterized protein n=1 Tax=Daucus carota subsp. sativus TaxID=79200 RepID=A0A162AKD4_DAUCS|nr:PREDICTED: uncharacterized protein LOC108196269 [Daucus carota subsp. sativus]WOG83857.1 hypothetical protein DCAR_0103035 [Daucus carota subsp. sativus]